MIIFDDKDFVKQLKHGEVMKNKYSNSVLRACSRMVNIGAYDYVEMCNIIERNTNFDIGVFWSYVENNADPLIAVPHSIVFYKTELQSCMTLKKQTEQKIYLYLLFLFKYFKTKRIKVSFYEIKVLAGIQNQNRWNLKNIKIGPNITARREKTLTNEIVETPRNHKIYWYYYPKKCKEKAFEFEYEGDSYLLSRLSFNSNLCELWVKFEEFKKGSSSGKGRK
ncbi:MAG: hypothetical protein AB9836_04560 [Aminipila sp.]